MKLGSIRCTVRLHVRPLPHTRTSRRRAVLKAERKRAERQRRAQEEQRIRQEEARIAAEHAQAVTDEHMCRRRLRTEANRWAQSRRIREYVAHIETVTQEQEPPDESLARWMDWALQVARDLDPTDERLSGNDE